MPLRLIGPRRQGGAFYKKRPTVRNPRGPKTKLSKPTATAVRRIAKAVIRKEAEDKMCGLRFTHSFNSSISSASECYSLVGQIVQGDDINQRVGDKIRGKYLIVRGKVQYDGGLGASVPFVPPSTVRLMILSQKNIKLATDVATRVDTGHLLKDGYGSGGTAFAYTGGEFDNLTPINREIFKVHMDRKVKFNWINQQGLTSGVPNVEWQSGNERTKYFYCKIKCPKTLVFDDGSVNVPNNFAPFFCMGAVCDDGASPWTVNTPYRVSVSAILHYEDA